MALCKIAETPLLTHWSYCSLALSHRHDVMGEQWTYIATATMIPVMAFPNTGNLIFVHKIFLSTLQWRHSESYGVSKRQRIDCLLNYFFFWCTSKKTPKIRLTGLCEGIHRWAVDSLHKGPVTQKIWWRHHQQQQNHQFSILLVFCVCLFRSQLVSRHRPRGCGI